MISEKLGLSHAPTRTSTSHFASWIRFQSCGAEFWHCDVDFWPRVCRGRTHPHQEHPQSWRPWLTCHWQGRKGHWPCPARLNPYFMGLGQLCSRTNGFAEGPPSRHLTWLNILSSRKSWKLYIPGGYLIKGSKLPMANETLSQSNWNTIQWLLSS